MLGDLPRNAGISKGFHAKMSLLPRRKSTSALSYSGESVVPMRTVFPSVLPGSMRTSLEPSTGSKDPVDFLGSGTFFGDLLLDGGELSGGYDCCSMIATLDLALIGALEGGANGDDPTRAWHLELQVSVVGDGMNFA